MKKNLFWTILAGAALVSCVNDDVLEQHNQNRQELTFGNPVLNSQTKVTGEISGTTYPTDENFIVWGIETTGNYQGWGASNAASFFGANGVVVTNDGYTDSYWHIMYGSDDAAKYYWPSEATHKLTFAACSPARVTAHATVTYDATGLQLKDYKMPAEPNDHFDIMYSPRVLNVTESPVTINFSHALSSIVFQTVKPSVEEGGAYSIKITDITLSGKIENQGTFKYAYGNASTSSTGTAGWTNRSVTDNTIKYDLLNEPFEVPTTSSPIAKVKPFLAIPQTVNSDMKVSITYQIVQQAGETAVELTKDFAFTDFKLPNTNGNYTNSWDMSNRYKYHIHFGKLKEITFAPTVNDWTTKDAGEVEISTSSAAVQEEQQD